MDKSNNEIDVQKTEALWSTEHFTELNENLGRFFEDQQFCDITLISADGKYKMMAHKNVLASVSKYFHVMFGGSLSESEAKEVQLSQIDGQSLKLILTFIYKGIIELTVDTVESVLTASHILGLTALEKLCCGYMKKNLDVSNCLGISYLAKLLNYDDLNAAATLCACENFVALRDEAEFHLLSFEQLCELISNDDLRMPSEGDVFHNIMSWINHKKHDRNQFLEKLCAYIRFPLLSPTFIAKIFAEEAGPSEMLRVICKAMIWHAVPDMRSKMFSHEQSKIRNFKDVIVAISGCKSTKRDLCVGLYYSGLGEWVHTKWPAIPYRRTNFKFTIFGEKLLIAGGKDGYIFSNSVHCLNLKTLEWTEYPQLTIPQTNALITVNDTVYALGDTSFNKLVEPFHKWTTHNVSNITFSSEYIIQLYAVFENLIYFIQDEYYCTYNLDDDAFNTRMMARVSTSAGFNAIGIHIITHSCSNFLVELDAHTAYVYDLETFTWVMTNPISIDLEDMKTALYGKKIIIYGKENVFYVYDVFTDQMHELPQLINECSSVDILLTSNSNEIA